MITWLAFQRNSTLAASRIWGTAVTLVLAFCCALLVAPKVQAAQIWMAASEPAWRLRKDWPQNDYLELFRSDAQWPHARSQVSVFELSRLAALQTSDGDLDVILSGLRRAHIKLAIEAAHMLAGRDCEGSRAADELVQILTRMKNRGGEVAYIRMDEPLWFNHAFAAGRPGTSPCIKSIDDLAKMTAARMRAARTVFPKVIIGDIEPMGVPSEIVPEWPSDIQSWLAAYQSAMGEKLAFFQTDVVWIRPSWRSMLTTIAPIIRQHGIPLGVVYNGTPNDASDADWVSDAEQHFRLVEGQLHILPDQVMFQTWMDRPRAMLPESSPSTFTGLIDDYLSWSGRPH